MNNPNYTPAKGRPGPSWREPIGLTPPETEDYRTKMRTLGQQLKVIAARAKRTFDEANDLERRRHLTPGQRFSLTDHDVHEFLKTAREDLETMGTALDAVQAAIALDLGPMTPGAPAEPVED